MIVSFLLNLVSYFASDLCLPELYTPSPCFTSFANSKAHFFVKFMMKSSDFPADRELLYMISL